MKKFILFMIGTFFLLTVSLLAPSQPPFNPPNPYVNGNGSGISGGGLHNTAPLDGGLGVLLVLASAFGIKKIYMVRKKRST